jgi:hypothetical protein
MNITGYTVVVIHDQLASSSTNFRAKDDAVEYFRDKAEPYGHGILLEHKVVTNGDDIDFKTRIIDTI